MEESYWNTDYWHSMDRSKGKEDIININPQQIGISHGIGDPLQGLKGNIFVGASKVELGFMGQKKGFRGQPTGWTPGSVSRRCDSVFIKFSSSLVNLAPEGNSG